MIVLIGGGGHAAVVYDILQLLGEEVIGYYDDRERSVHDDKLSPLAKLRVSYLGRLEDLAANPSRENYRYICCIGDNAIRRELVHKLQASFPAISSKWLTAIHPSAIIASSATITAGSVIAPGVIISANVIIGAHSIINSASTVNHDSLVGDYSHIAPGSQLCGNVTIGNGVLIGVASKILPKISVGDNAIVGAGSTVLCAVSADQQVMGVVKRQQIKWLPHKHCDFRAIQELLAASIARNQFSNNGPCVEALEQQLYSLLGVDRSTKRIILSANGTTALHALVSGVALKLRLGRELKLATQAFTFPASVQGPLAGSLIVDIDEEGGLDLEALEHLLLDEAIALGDHKEGISLSLPNVEKNIAHCNCGVRNKAETKLDGVVVTNCFGNLVDIEKYERWASKHQKLLFFDNAATACSYYRGRNSVNYGTGSIISFHHTKPLGFGEGGAIIVDCQYEASVRQILNFGYDVPRGDVLWLASGSNYKMSDVSASFIAAYLQTIAAGQTIVRALIAEARELLPAQWFPNSVSGAGKENQDNHGLLSNISLLFKEKVTIERVKFLAEKYQIDLRKYYKPLSQVPRAQELWDRVVCFPLHCEMTRDDLLRYRELCRELQGE